MVSLDQHSSSQAVLETALILGRSFESYIEGSSSRNPSTARSRSLVVATRLTVRSGRLRFNSAIAAGGIPGVVAMIAPTDRNPYPPRLRALSVQESFGVIQNAAGIADHKATDFGRHHA